MTITTLSRPDEYTQAVGCLRVFGAVIFPNHTHGGQVVGFKAPGAVIHLRWGKARPGNNRPVTVNTGVSGRLPIGQGWHRFVTEGKLNSNQRRQGSYAFPSTSAAGAVCNGRSTAGPIAWKVKGTKKTYKEWEAETLAEY